MKTKLLLTLLALVTWCGAWAQSLPFETSTSKDANDARWYTLQFKNQNGNTSAYVPNAQATQLGQDATNAIFPNNIDNYSFCFVVSGEGYHIYNKATGKAVFVDNVTDHAPVKVGENPTLIKGRFNGAEFFLYDAGFANPVDEQNTLASWSNKDGFIAISTGRTNYNGSRLVIAEVEFDEYTLSIGDDDNGEGRLIINGSEYANGATIKWPNIRAINQSYLSAKAVSGCLTDVTLNTSAKTITVTYTSGYDVTYNVTATDVTGANEISFTRIKRELLNATPNLELDYFSNINITNSAAVDAEHTSFDVTATYNYPMMPGKFYYLKCVEKKYVNYVSDTEANINADKVENDPKFLWYVVSKGDNSFWLCNVEKGQAVVGENNTAAAVTFGEATGSTQTYEFVKTDDTQFRFFWPNNSGQNLGAHGTSDRTANAALGKWNTGRNEGSNFIVEEFDAGVLEPITVAHNNGNSAQVGYYSGNFAEYVNAYNGFTANNTAADLRTALNAKTTLSRKEIEEGKYYKITFSRGNQAMGNYGAVANAGGTVDTGAASRTITTADANSANLLASLWQFENDANGVYLKTAQSRFYLANVDGGHLVTTKEKQYGKVFTLSNGNNNSTTWQMSENGKNGNATINIFYNPGNNDSREIGYWSANDGGDFFALEEVTQIPVTIGEVGYSTVCFPMNVVIPETVKAYIIASTTSTSAVLEQVTGILPAGAGVILKNEGTHNFTITSDDATAEVGDNRLIGTTVRRTGFDQDANYVLANKEDGVGLYKNGTIDAVPANKAYLPASNVNSQVKAFFFEEDMETAIEKIMAEQLSTSNIYDLQGRQVAMPTKGLYIINGKKVLVK